MGLNVMLIGLVGVLVIYLGWTRMVLSLRSVWETYCLRHLTRTASRIVSRAAEEGSRTHKVRRRVAPKGARPNSWWEHFAYASVLSGDCLSVLALEAERQRSKERFPER